MHYTTKFVLGLLGTTALSVGATPFAYATATNFGPANGGASTGAPTVNTSAPSINWANRGLLWTSGTGSLGGIWNPAQTTGTPNGKINGTITFGATAGSIQTETVTGFLNSISLNGNTYTFDVSQVTTVSYHFDPLSSGSVSLYILGMMGGGSDTPTSTSLTLTANDTSNGPWTSSFSLSNPPSAVPPIPPSVPEPASLALLGTGLIGLSTLRRRRKQ